MNVLKSKPYSLKKVLELLNSEISILTRFNIKLIFDGTYNGKLIELRFISTYFEDEECLMMMLFDMNHRDVISKLEQIDKYKNILLSNVSHELRNPLNSSISMIKLAVENQTVPLEVREELLEPSLRSLGMLINLINDILDSSQIEAGKLKLVFQPVDLRQLIFDACILIDTQCLLKGIKLRVFIDTNIPDIFVTDPNRLTQILLNLMSNALKFTKKGYIRVIVKCVNNDEELIFISVQDTGIGIKKDDIKYLFKEYGKLELGNNSSLNPTGCGLGLNISYKLSLSLGKKNTDNKAIHTKRRYSKEMSIEGMNRKGIHVESEVNKGSVFSFIIHDKKNDYEQNATMLTMMPQSHIITSTKSVIGINCSDNSANILNNKIYQKFNKHTLNEEDFDLLIEEGNKEDAKKYSSILLKENTRHNTETDGAGRYLMTDSIRPLISVEKSYQKNHIQALFVYDKKDKNTSDFNYLMDVSFDLAYSVDSAINKIESSMKKEGQFEFDLVILDDNMNINDIDTINRKIKEKKEQMKVRIDGPIVVVSLEWSDEEIKDKYREMDINQFIQKPVSKSDLVKILIINK